MATKTSDKAAAGVQPRAIHAGVNSVYAVYSANGASLSAGDVIQMVKVPDGGRLTGLKFRPMIGTVHLSVGDGDDADRYAASAVYDSTGTWIDCTLNLGHQYDQSDAAAVHFDTIDVTVVLVSAVSISGVIEMIADYVMDNEV